MDSRHADALRKNAHLNESCCVKCSVLFLLLLSNMVKVFKLDVMISLHVWRYSAGKEKKKKPFCDTGLQSEGRFRLTKTEM